MQEQNVANIPLAKTQGDAKNTSRTSGQKHRNIREAMEPREQGVQLYH